MNDNVVWVDFTKKQKTKRKVKNFLLSFIGIFKNIFSKFGKKRKLKKISTKHKSINY